MNKKVFFKKCFCIDNCLPCFCFSLFKKYFQGILSDDTVLAAAVWRTLYSCQHVDPQLLEKAVLYIRKQLSYLDSQNSEHIIFKGTISFLSLKSIFSDYK